MSQPTWAPCKLIGLHQYFKYSEIGKIKFLGFQSCGLLGLGIFFFYLNFKDRHLIIIL